jgi:ketosteroid isomerase-like protein
MRHSRGMSSTKRSLFAAASAGLASLTLACATHPTALSDEVHRLIELSEKSNQALMRGDIEQYVTLIKQTEDFTLMSPFGGKPTHGAIDKERMHAIGKFFKNGTLQQELVHAYGSPDMVVLAIIERAHVEVGGLPAQDWALRVTLVYRREGSEWHLAHRHADPLGAGAISVTESAALARGERNKTGG